MRHGVVPDIQSNLDRLQNQVIGVSEGLTALQNSAITDIKLGPLEHSQAWKGAGYQDQAGFVITEVSNFNRDEFLDHDGRRKLTKKVNGNWYDVGA